MNEKGNAATRRARGSRRVPHLLMGMLLVLGCVGGAVWWTSSAADRVPVLVMARPVTVGQVLTQADVHTADLSAPAGIATVPAGQAASVLGRPMATSLEPGAVLTPSSVGAPAIATAGRSVAAVGLKPGQFPPAISPGTPVTVVVTAGTAPGTATTASTQRQGASWPATVVGLAPAGTDQTTVLSLELEAATAVEVAQVPAGQVALVLQPAGGGR